MPRFLIACCLAVLLIGLQAGCENDLIEPELVGSIEGQVLDFETSAPLAGVGVTTSPPTGALVSDSEGRFRIESIPTGSYTVAGRRNGYDPNSVTISVRPDETTSAILFLQEEAEEDTTSVVGDLEATVLNFTTRARSDTTFVVVEYRVRNTGTVDIALYEVYFQLFTDGPTFFEEVQGTDLRVDQSDIGEFEQFVGGAEVSSVEVSDIFFEEAPDEEPVGSGATAG